MMMVVLLHILGNGGILSSTPSLSKNYYIAWFLEISAYCAVNCYALISGYVGINSHYKYSNIIQLWLQVFFYTTLITLFFYHIAPLQFDTNSWIKAFLPVTHNQYWYFTAYFCMFFFIPYFNILLNQCTKGQMTLLLLTMFLFFSILPTFCQTDLFQTANGYSFIWLCILYLTGGYIKKYYSNISLHKRYIFSLYLICVFLTLITIYIFEFPGIPKPSFIQSGDFLCYYTSPTIVVAGICLLIFFANLHLNIFFQKIIKQLAPLSFGVYLIHTQPFIWSRMTNYFVEYATYSSFKMLLHIFMALLIIYFTCSILEYFRSLLFRICHINVLCKKIDKKICFPVFSPKS